MATFLVGSFPPPVHGMALVNAFVRERLVKGGALTRVIDLAPSSIRRNPLVRLARVSKVIGGVLSYMRNGTAYKDGKIYIGVSGGYGQAYDLIFVVVARFFGHEIFLHHHSFAYIDKAFWVTRILIKVAGRAACHLALCPAMAAGLAKRYKSAIEVEVIPNAFIIREVARSLGAKARLKTVGFLGNITYEKGIIEFLTVADAFRASDIVFLVAGPFQGMKVQKDVMTKWATIENVRYVGPQYGANKWKFLDSIDTLLFPSKYVNEAQPLTVLESMACGVPVIARERGCIRMMLESSGGLLVEMNQDFVSCAIDQIHKWIGNPEKYQASSLAALQKFRVLHSQSRTKYDSILRRLTT